MSNLQKRIKDIFPVAVCPEEELYVDSVVDLIIDEFDKEIDSYMNDITIINKRMGEGWVHDLAEALISTEKYLKNV